MDEIDDSKLVPQYGELPFGLPQHHQEEEAQIPMTPEGEHHLEQPQDETPMLKYYIIISRENVVVYDGEKYGRAEIEAERSQEKLSMDYTTCVVRVPKKCIELSSKIGRHILFKDLKFDVSEPMKVVAFLKSVYENDRESLGGNRLFGIIEENDNKQPTRPKGPREPKEPKAPKEPKKSVIHETVIDKKISDLTRQVQKLTQRVSHMEKTLDQLDRHPVIAKMSNLLKRLSLVEMLIKSNN